MRASTRLLGAAAVVLSMSGCASGPTAAQPAPSHTPTSSRVHTSAKPTRLGPLGGISLSGAAKILECTHITDLTDNGPFTGYIGVNDYEFAGSCRRNGKTAYLFVYNGTRRQTDGAHGYLLNSYPQRLVLFNGLTVVAANHREARQLQRELGGRLR